MPDRWQSNILMLEGGLIENQPPLLQGNQAPGSLIDSVNFEPSLDGGYGRIKGYSLFDEDPIPGEGEPRGVFVFDGSIVGCREDGVYISSGSGWTELNESDPRSGTSKYQAVVYDYVEPVIILTDGNNPAAKYTASQNYTEIDHADAPSAPSTCAEFKSHLFLGQANILYFSAPLDDENFDAVDGAGEINVGRDIVALKVFRDELYVFSQNTIQKLVGNNAEDFVLQPVTQNIGCIAGRTVQEIGGDILFLAPDGVRTISATERINDVELGSISRQIQKTLTGSYSRNSFGNICACTVRAKSQYRLFMTRPDIAKEEQGGFIAALRPAEGGVSWEWYKLRGFNVVACDSSYFDNEEVIVHANYDGYVLRQEDGNSFDGDNVEAFFQTVYNPLDDPAIRKTIYKGEFYIQTRDQLKVRIGLIYDYDNPEVLQPQRQTVELSREGGVAIYDEDGVLYDGDFAYADESPFPVAIRNLVGSGQNVSITVESNDINEPYSIRGIVMEYGLGGRR